MEYIYGAMLLHSTGQEITEDSMKKVLSAANLKADESRIKALIASLEDVNIDEAIATAAVSAAPAPAPAAAEAAPAEEKAAEEKKKEAEEDETKKEEEAAEGLASLFG